ncbi:MAG: alpha-L-rhamnosidase N-terminal domain-containing protein [Bacteroidales bacterium]|nr:alpha-L-rhamnosidase N-terminal domain-containing protein [Bacteroidales bacterium]
MKHTFILVLFFLFQFSISAQESKAIINEEGKDFSTLKHSWSAQWITHPTASTLDFGAFLFRRSFDLTSVPKKFTIYISADNKYRLYVNGQYVGFGPETGDINHYRYETRDIAPFLNAGKNTIAAEVINFGEYRKALQQTFQTAFICQFDASLGKNDLNTGKPGWKVIKNDGRGVMPFVSDSMRGYYAAGPCDVLFANKFPWGWETPNFNDENWLKPKLATVEFAAGRGFLYGSTWFLVPRSIPYLAEKKLSFSKFYNFENKQPIPLKSIHNLTIPAHSIKRILIDNETHTTGFPELIFSKGKNASLKITYAEALFDSAWLKGNRNELAGKQIQGYYDKVYPDGFDYRSFVSTAMRTFRFIQLDIETKDDPLRLDNFFAINTAYPFEQEASFKCDNDTVNKTWENSWRTLQNSAFDDFMDPYYEQLQYIGDTRIEALIAYSMSSDKRLVRKAMVSFDDSRLPNGLTQSRYPSYIVQVIPPYSLLWISMIHDFMIIDGDKEFIRQRLDGVETVLSWFSKKVDSTGMLTNLDWWNFTDWAAGFPNGIPPGADNGYSATINLQYVMALQRAAEIYNYLGDTEKSNKAQLLAQKVKAAVVKRCLNAKNGLIAETPEQKIYSQHCNILAILTDAIPADKQAAVMTKILSDKSLIQTTIYFKFYLFEALLKSGKGNEYLSLLDNWKNMMRNGLTTFAETDINPRSECHAWSASPVYHLLKIVAGIQPTKPGFNGIVIAPNMGMLNSIDAKMPCKDGVIMVKLTKDKTKQTVTVEITLPQAKTGKFLWNGQETPLIGGKQILKLQK